MTLNKVIAKKAKKNMVVVSDVDGVHTTRAGGVQIGACPTGSSGILQFSDGTEVLRLVAADVETSDVEVILGGFSGQKVWEFYRFHTPDGQGVQNLLRHHLRMVIVSGRKAAPVQHRFGETLKHECGREIFRPEVYLGIKDKLGFFTSTVSLDLSTTLFIGDGAQDALLMQAIKESGGIAVATADAEAEAVEAADCTTCAKGGEGAFAELAKAYLDWLGK